MAEYESKVRLNAEDICSRGRLIANYPRTWLNRTGTRIDHLLWMIRHHPEWDGFTADPAHALANPRSQQERESYDQLKEAWLQQVEPTQHRAIVLHNAAMFFAVRERELTVALLKRAIATEPEERLYVERLGMVYAYSLVPPTCFGRNGFPDTPELQSFARQAREALLQSDDWVLVAGALNAGDAMSGCTAWRELNLHAKLRELKPKGMALPSQTSRYCRTQCPMPPTERQ